jgi:hypothetical protein
VLSRKELPPSPAMGLVRCDEPGHFTSKACAKSRGFDYVMSEIELRFSRGRRDFPHIPLNPLLLKLPIHEDFLRAVGLRASTGRCDEEVCKAN